MKKRVFFQLWALLAFMPLFTACSDDNDLPLSSPVEMYNVLMFVTNDADEDLISSSDMYWHYNNTFRFDTWEIFLDGKLIQTGDQENRYFEKGVNYLQQTDVDHMYICLHSNMYIQERIKDYTETHVAEYVVSSASLFGDTEKHNIRMEFRGVLNEHGFPTTTEYSISVDGTTQEVLYPQHWRNLSPNSPYGSVIFPSFVLNVDKIKK